MLHIWVQTRGPEDLVCLPTSVMLPRNRKATDSTDSICKSSLPYLINIYSTKVLDRLTLLVFLSIFLQDTGVGGFGSGGNCVAGVWTLGYRQRHQHRPNSDILFNPHLTLTETFQMDHFDGEKLKLFSRFLLILIPFLKFM